MRVVPRCLGCAAIGLAATLVGGAAHADTLINFDNLPVGTAVDTQYVVQGAVFDGQTGFPGFGAHISNDATPHSGSNVLINAPLPLEFAFGPITFTFVTPQQRVQLFGGYVLFNTGSPTTSATLRGFDQNGNQVAIDGPKTTLGGQTSTLFSISSSQANIAKVTFDTGPFNNTVIDDLQFGGGATAPPPTSPPVVTVTLPQAGTSNYTVEGPPVIGSVAGPGLLPNVRMTFQLLTPPPISGFPILQFLQTPLIFSFTPPVFVSGAIGPLLIGNYVLTATATNSAGASGTAIVRLTNMPVLDATLAGQLGGFHFAEPAGACQVAVFDNGGFAYFPADGTLIQIPQAILTKWLDVQNGVATGGAIIPGQALGCPIGPATPNATVPPTSKLVAGLGTQDFVGGRIYAPAGGTAHWTPTVLVNAITTISTLTDVGASPDLQAFNDPLGTTEVGIPTADPSYDLSGEEPTWLFQRFARPGFTGDPNTLEIRGRQPTLYLERVGGGFADYAAINRTPDSNTPTQWETYPCQNGTFGQIQCTVSRPHIRSVVPRTVPTPIYTTTTEIGNLDQYCPPTVFDLPVFVFTGGTIWSAVPGKTNNFTGEPTSGDFVNVHVTGWIQSSEHASVDLPAVHAHMHFDATGDATTAAGTVVGCVIGSFFGPLGFVVGCGTGAYAGHQAAGETGGWADWGLQVRPLALTIPDPNAAWLVVPPGTALAPPYWDLMASNADPSLDGQNGNQVGDIESEWEADWQNWNGIDGLQDPPVGNMVILNGRWIVDCGHPPFHSEIHPPNTVITLGMAAGVAGNSTYSTKVQTWGSELYQGVPFQTSIWAPPRPTPTAQLSAVLESFNPSANNADGSITYDFINAPIGPLNPPAEPTTVSLSFAPDGLAASFAGPASTHRIEDTGQVILPGDEPDTGDSAAADYLGLWYVGWNQ